MVIGFQGSGSSASYFDAQVCLKPKKPSVSIWRDDLPMFVDPSRAELRRNAEVVLAKWDTQHRDFVVTFDDTCDWPQWSLQGFPEPLGMVYIGGAGDKSKVSCEPHSPGVLKKEDLSQTCVSYLLKRASTRKQPFDICETEGCDVQECHYADRHRPAGGH